MKPSEMDPRPGTATRSTLTRRRLLNTLAASGVAVVGGVALAASKDPTLAAAAVPYAAGGGDESEETLSGINPTRALRALLAGNKRFAAGRMLHPRLSVQRRAQGAPSRARPFVSLSLARRSSTKVAAPFAGPRAHLLAAVLPPRSA